MKERESEPHLRFGHRLGLVGSGRVGGPSAARDADGVGALLAVADLPRGVVQFGARAEPQLLQALQLLETRAAARLQRGEAGAVLGEPHALLLGDDRAEATRRLVRLLEQRVRARQLTPRVLHSGRDAIAYDQLISRLADYSLVTDQFELSLVDS